MQAIDWTDMYQRYKGQWVAIDARDETTVVAAGSDARQVFEESQRSGTRAILHRIPEKIVDFVGYAL